MAKKYCYTEFEASKKGKPKIVYEARYSRESRYRRREWIESEDESATTSELYPINKKPQPQPPCTCQRETRKPTVVESDSSDPDSIQGYGFIDHYRLRGPKNNLHDDLEDTTDIDTSELFNVDRYTRCLRKSSSKDDRESYDEGPSTSQKFRKSPSEETLAHYEAKKPSSSSSSRAEPPKPDKPTFFPMSESYIRSLFRAVSHQVDDDEPQGHRREDKRFMREAPPKRPSVKSPEWDPFRNPYALRSSSSRLPCRNPNAPRSSARFSPRFQPRQPQRSESSDDSLTPRGSLRPGDTESERPADTESEISVAQTRTESQTSPVEAESSELRSNSSECYSEFPSLGKRIVRESRRNLEMDNSRTSRTSKTFRICGGERENPCMRKPSETRSRTSRTSRTSKTFIVCAGKKENPCLRKPSEPRYKVTSSSRMHVRPCCGSPKSESKPKRSSFKWKTYLQPTMPGENPPVRSLLSPRHLAYTPSNCSMWRKSKQSQQTQRTSETSHLTPPNLGDFSDLPEVSSITSRPVPDCRCSMGQRLPSLHSRHTFTNIWRKNPKPFGSSESVVTTSGGLYSCPDKLKFAPIDRLDAGVSLTPIVEGSKSLVRERIRYFAYEFDRLSIKERMEDTELRFRQIRKMLARADRSCLKYYHGRKADVWPMNPEGHQYFCSIGHKRCPPVSDETSLSHMMLYHHDEKGIELREIFAGDRLLLIFNPRSYILDRVSCMSALAYAGVYKDPSTLPGRRFMPIKNKHLPRIYAKYPEHLPLFVMICKLRKSHPSVRQSRHGYRVERDDVMILWMTSVDLPYPVHAIMTIMNRRMDATRSTVLQVRPLHESQDCLDIMQSSCQYMRLSETDLRVLSSDDSEPLYLEVSVKEYAGTLEGRSSSELDGN